MPTKSASSASTLARARANTGKKTPSQSIFANVKQQPKEMSITTNPTQYASNQRPAEVTPKSSMAKAKYPRAFEGRSRTPNDADKQGPATPGYNSAGFHGRKKSTT